MAALFVAALFVAALFVAALFACLGVLMIADFAAVYLKLASIGLRFGEATRPEAPRTGRSGWRNALWAMR